MDEELQVLQARLDAFVEHVRVLPEPLRSCMAGFLSSDLQELAIPYEDEEAFHQARHTASKLGEIMELMLRINPEGSLQALREEAVAMQKAPEDVA